MYINPTTIAFFYRSNSYKIFYSGFLLRREIVILDSGEQFIGYGN